MKYSQLFNIRDFDHLVHQVFRRTAKNPEFGIEQIRMAMALAQVIIVCGIDVFGTSKKRFPDSGVMSDYSYQRGCKEADVVACTQMQCLTLSQALKSSTREVRQALLFSLPPVPLSLIFAAWERGNIIRKESNAFCAAQSDSRNENDLPGFSFL